MDARREPSRSGALGASLKGTVRALRIRNYRLFWFGQLISLTGRWMQRVAQAWLVLELTDSPLALAMVTILQFAPITLLTLFGGVLADRVPKRRLLLFTQALQMTQALIIAILVTADLIQLWQIYLLALVLGLAGAFDNPGRQAMIVEMVGPEDLANAVALNSSLMNSARIIGPAIAGGIIAVAGVNACFWINAVSYLAVIGALLAMRPHEFFDVPAPSRGRVFGQIRDGLAYAVRSRDVCLVLILMAPIGMFGFNYTTIVPLLGRYVLDAGPAGFGALFSCIGVGSVAAALLIAGRREATEGAVRLGAAGFTLLYFLVAVSPWYLLTSALLVLLGAAATLFTASSSTRLQTAAPAQLRGRVMSIYALLFMGSTPIGAYFIGSLSESSGVPTALAVCAGICSTGVIAGELYVRRRPPELARSVSWRQPQRPV